MSTAFQIQGQGYNHRVARLRASTALGALAGVMLAFSLPGTAWAVEPLTTPTGETVVGGSASFDRPQAGQLNVTQGSSRVIIDWDRFDIGQNATTRFQQPGSSALAVNRVRAAGTDPTQILGTLTANGQVMVLDRNGVIFGKDSVVDVGGIVASTGSVDEAAVMRGDRQLDLFDFAENSSVETAGRVTVAEGGLAAFVAPQVRNSGVISAKLGRVALAAGEAVTVDLYGDGLVEVAADRKLSSALVENSGTLAAEGGRVVMTAAAAKGVVDSAINLDGIVTAASATVQGGKIVLSGPSVRVGKAATLDVSGGAAASAGEIRIKADGRTRFDGTARARGGATGGNGGLVEISGKDEVLIGGAVDTRAPAGTDGLLLLDPVNYVLDTTNSQTWANLLRTTNAEILADNSVTVSEAVDLSTYDDAGTGITTHNLTLTAPTLNVNGEIILGKGEFIANGDVLNLGARIYGRAVLAGPLTLLGSGRLSGVPTVVNVTGVDASIQQGIDLAGVGAAITVAAGSYNGGLVIDKALTLTGAGSDAATGTVVQGAGGGHGVRLASGDVTLRGLRVDGFANGVFVPVGASISDVVFDDLAVVNNVYGFRVPGLSSVNGLTVTGSAFDDNLDRGWWIGSDRVVQTSFDDILVSDTSFNGNGEVGLYAEKMSHALFTDIEVVDSGTRTDVPFAHGIDLNLINGDYADITFSGLTVMGSGVDAVNTGSAIAIKGRDDAPYDVNPASLTGVLIENAVVDAPGSQAFKIGNNITGVTIRNSEVTGRTGVLAFGGVDGLEVEDSRFSGGVGVEVRGGVDHWIHSNAFNVRGTGVLLRGVRDTLVGGDEDGNTFSEMELAVLVRNSRGVDVIGNSMDDVYDGIDVVDSHDVEVSGNTLERIGNDGIRIRTEGDGPMPTLLSVAASSLSPAGFDIRVLDNDLSYLGGDGVQVIGVSSVLVADNSIHWFGDDGVDVTGVYELPYWYDYGRVSALTTETESASGVVIRDNDIGNSWDPYGEEYRVAFREGWYSSDYDLGDQDGYGRNGIEAGRVENLEILNNTIHDVADDGILVQGQGDRYEYDTFSVALFVPSTTVISGNGVSNAGYAGIHFMDLPSVEVTDNSVTDSGSFGLYAEGWGNGDILFSGNAFSGNPVGARFESGHIDMRGASNRFTGGEIGLQFDPAGYYASAKVSLEGEGNGYPYPYPPSLSDLVLVGDTIGSSIFEGQSQFYVDLRDGAFFAPGFPTLLDGTQASYDGILPAATSNFLSSAQFAAVENGLYHYTDQDGRGLFFFGEVPPPSPTPTPQPQANIAQEDILPQYTPSLEGAPGAFRVTILGLPRIPGLPTPPALGGGLPTPQILGALAPQAGGTPGEDEIVDFSPQEIVSTPEAVAGVEPAAGAGAAGGAPQQQDTHCLQDVGTSLDAGRPITYSYGGSMNEVLSDTAQCGVRAQ